METTLHTKLKATQEFISISRAAEELGVNRTWLTGYLAAKGIPLMPIGKSHGVHRKHLRKVRVPGKEATS